MELNKVTEEELLKELAERIKPKSISAFSTDELIEELDNRHLSSWQESELLDMSDHKCEEDLELKDFDDWELVDYLSKRGYGMIEVNNLMDEQKFELLEMFMDKFTYNELEELFNSNKILA